MFYFNICFNNGNIEIIIKGYIEFGGQPVTVNCYRVQQINRLTVKPSTYMLVIICSTWYLSLACLWLLLAFYNLFTHTMLSQV